LEANHTWLADCRIENLANVTIGDHVCISQKAMLLTGNHDYKKVGFDLITKEIILENGVWIGANATVCPGITAHSHAVLTVGSVATRNLEAYSIYQGNPAVKVKDRVILAD
jgi:putative colanic acid biosynthesis acetyltransferase WcaF